ncbi:hypothetical protein [Methylobacterium oryzae]|uniref:hypothetical protein n=1 Tax=Methylobacterium oryzae TaxID=334852 RepID=UPI001F3EA705|nr:hypothetical protein [Methylobacterium oryzae]UIN38333.1 hypothetical protein LXM90_31350 [Methylobacterium oryzae]
MSDEAQTDETSATPTPPAPTRIQVRKVQVKDFLAEEDLKGKLAYSLNDLSSAMADQASLFAHFGVLAAKASRQVDNIKILIENQEAKVDREIREAMAVLGEKITEGIVERKIARHPQVVAFKRALNEAKQIEKVANTTLEAFRHRRDMLVQAGATSREEMKGELSMAAKRELADNAKSAAERVGARAARTMAESE